MVFSPPFISPSVSDLLFRCCHFGHPFPSRFSFVFAVASHCLSHFLRYDLSSVCVLPQVTVFFIRYHCRCSWLQAPSDPFSPAEQYHHLVVSPWSSWCLVENERESVGGYVLLTRVVRVGVHCTAFASIWLVTNAACEAVKPPAFSYSSSVCGFFFFRSHQRRSPQRLRSVCFFTCSYSIDVWCLTVLVSASLSLSLLAVFLFSRWCFSLSLPLSPPLSLRCVPLS